MKHVSGFFFGGGCQVQIDHLQTSKTYEPRLLIYPVCFNDLFVTAASNASQPWLSYSFYLETLEATNSLTSLIKLFPESEESSLLPLPPYFKLLLFLILWSQQVSLHSQVAFQGLYGFWALHFEFFINSALTMTQLCLGLHPSYLLLFLPPPRWCYFIFHVIFLSF